MSTTTITIGGQSHSITYDVTDSDKGKYFKVTDIPPQWNMGDEYTFRVWEENNAYEIPEVENANADAYKAAVVTAVLKEENIDYIT